MQNERGEYVTIGEIEEFPPTTGNFKSSIAQLSNKQETYNIAEKIKKQNHQDRFSDDDGGSGNIDDLEARSAARSQ